MPESKSRKKPAKVKAPQVKKPETGNPRWLVPTMLTLMLLGLAWIVIFYLTSGGLGLPIPALHNWNLVIGFVLIIAGFALTTRWK
ncbi:cell division protein CrgA [Oerskovia enterophila]|uniref:Cell division protein CrgA n=1 Tax=Oerskovia enterophila TaxID=43678 RepID=A0A161YEI4_9CELL|nr:cell division protein CrgA [Oerskovia enterophila]KZM34208.1 cell division protein CrgA [Oerskovia enterophila]OCI31459.1 cell division protein CrgA [Oerskovia enterophila]